jgi:preprotein translocase subunit SecG
MHIGVWLFILIIVVALLVGAVFLRRGGRW